MELLHSLLRRNWYVAVIFGLELFWFAVIALRVRLLRNHPEEAAAEASVPPRRIPLRGWRIVEVAYITYHMPVMLPLMSVGKTDSAPGWLLFLLTPVVYSAAALLAARAWA
jgi:hypothetical protein